MPPSGHKQKAPARAGALLAPTLGLVLSQASDSELWDELHKLVLGDSLAVKGVLPHDGLDFGLVPGLGQDDAAFARLLRPGHQEMPRGVIARQELPVLIHQPVHLRRRLDVMEQDDKQFMPPRMRESR